MKICDHILIGYVKGVDKHLKLLGFNLGLDDVYQIVHQLRDITFLVMDRKLSALDTAHIQNIVDKPQQVIAG